jgi:hypothetical protein
MSGHATSTAGADALNRRFSKTEAGRLEIRSRAMPLVRSSRNLLLIIDSTRTAAEWMEIVQGCDQAALQALQDAGLVVDVGTNNAGSSEVPKSPDTTLAPIPASEAAAPQQMSVAQALEQCSYSALYDRITAEARPRLGLIKAYKMIMDVEHCSDPTQIRALALRFIEQERDLHGEAAGKALAKLLTAPG